MIKIKRLFALSVALIIASSFYTSQAAYATVTNISMSPASQQVNLGTSFTVQIRGNSEQIGFVRSTTSGTVQFPASLLKVTHTSTAGSAYPDMHVSY